MIQCFLCGGLCELENFDERPGEYIRCTVCGVRSPEIDPALVGYNATDWWQKQCAMIDAIYEAIELWPGEVVE